MAAKESFFSSVKDFVVGLSKDLESAQFAIDFEVYIFEEGQVGDQLVDLLCAAARRGVAVRVMVDGAGTLYFSRRYREAFEKAGVAFRVFHPIPWHVWDWEYSGLHRGFFRSWQYFFSRINRRNHRKTCVIDRKFAWVGSFNVTDKNLSKSEGGENWKDVVVRIEHDSVQKLSEWFNATWGSTYFFSRRRLKRKIFADQNADKEYEVLKNIVFLTNHTRRKRKSFRKFLLHMLSLAQGRVWIVMAYFVPNAPILRVLENLSKQGVDVRIVLPHRSDVFFMPWVAAWFYDPLLQAGVKIFEYDGGILHSKIFLMRDRAIVGSSNLNNRSLFHDLELNVLLKNPDTLEQIENTFFVYQQDSEIISLEKYKNRSLVLRALAWLILRFRHWI